MRKDKNKETLCYVFDSLEIRRSCFLTAKNEFHRPTCACFRELPFPSAHFAVKMYLALPGTALYACLLFV